MFTISFVFWYTSCDFYIYIYIYSYSHFTDEETEGQRDEIKYVSSQRWHLWCQESERPIWLLIWAYLALRPVCKTHCCAESLLVLAFIKLWCSTCRGWLLSHHPNAGRPGFRHAGTLVSRGKPCGNQGYFCGFQDWPPRASWAMNGVPLMMGCFFYNLMVIFYS